MSYRWDVAISCDVNTGIILKGVLINYDENHYHKGEGIDYGCT